MMLPLPRGLHGAHFVFHVLRTTPRTLVIECRGKAFRGLVRRLGRP